METGGYMGCYTSQNIRLRDPALEKFFQNRNIGDTHADDIPQNDTEIIETETNERILHQGKRREFAERLLQFYDIIENNELYELRCQLEKNNISTVVCGLDSGIGEALSFDDLSIQLDQNSRKTEDRIMLSTIRLLKAAKSLSLEGGRNYFEELLAIPEVDALLSFVSKTKGFRDMKTKAIRKKRENPAIATYVTPIEQDKLMAQEYLEGDKKSQVTPESEIAYRRSLYQNSHGLVYLSKKPQPFIKKEEKGRAALDRMIARQEGKQIGEMLYSNEMGWYFETEDDSKYQSYVKERKKVASRSSNRKGSINMKDIQKLIKWQRINMDR